MRPDWEAPTARQLEILRYASHGMRVAQIASVLHVSPETVRTHLRTARIKLAAKNTCHACCIAIRQGLI